MQDALIVRVNAVNAAIAELDRDVHRFATQDARGKG
jgi:hypothetical protein